MSKQLEITTILKKAIQIAGIEQNNLKYFLDKRKSGNRRHKFYQVKPTDEQVSYLNKLLQIAGVKANAKILKADKRFGNYVSPYGNNCLVIHSK